MPTVLGAERRAGWDTPTRSAAQERFYRELMAADQLPSFPEVAQRVLVAVNRDDADLKKLSALVARDQALAARLLRLANSALFAIRGKVTSIAQAVTLLGFTRVRDIVLGLSVWGALDAKDAASKRYRKTMWSHTVTVAAAAKVLAERTGSDGSEAFTVGLLHDIGKLVLGLRLGASYWALLDEAAERNVGTAEVEEEAFGCHHGTVGGWLLQLWHLPPTLVDAVARHHDPLERAYGMDLPAVVAVADRLVTSTDASNGQVRNEVLEDVRDFAPGLLAADTWTEMYTGFAREERTMAGMFDR
jgi:putative nucleotidyltransferase with HDIG domain